MKGERNTFGVLLLNSHNHFGHATEKVRMENGKCITLKYKITKREIHEQSLKSVTLDTLRKLIMIWYS